MEKEIKKHNQAKAKIVVDMLFNTKMFKEGVTRDLMQAVEDFIAWEYQTSEDSIRKNIELQNKFNKLYK